MRGPPYESDPDKEWFISGSMITIQIQIENVVNDVYLICTTKNILSNKKRLYNETFLEMFNHYNNPSVELHQS